MQPFQFPSQELVFGTVSQIFSVSSNELVTEDIDSESFTKSEVKEPCEMMKGKVKIDMCGYEGVSSAVYTSKDFKVITKI